MSTSPAMTMGNRTAGRIKSSGTQRIRLAVEAHADRPIGKTHGFGTFSFEIDDERCTVGRQSNVEDNGGPAAIAFRASAVGIRETDSVAVGC